MKRKADRIRNEKSGNGEEEKGASDAQRTRGRLEGLKGRNKKRDGEKGPEDQRKFKNRLAKME